MNKKEKNKREKLLKWGNLSLRREDNYESVLRNEKIQEFEREKKLESILDRSKRIEQMK